MSFVLSKSQLEAHFYRTCRQNHHLKLTMIRFYLDPSDVVSERFCGISYLNDKSNILSYTVYLPTSGLDEEFLEVLSQLCSDINQYKQENSAIIIGADTNQSKKSSKRRIAAMHRFIQDFFLKPVLISDDPTFHHNNQTSVSQIDQILYFLSQIMWNQPTVPQPFVQVGRFR